MLRFAEAALIVAVTKANQPALRDIDNYLAGPGRLRYQRKALLSISEGGDNHSRYTEGEIKSLVREADVQIYVAGFFPWFRRLRKSRRGRSCCQRGRK